MSRIGIVGSAILVVVVGSACGAAGISGESDVGGGAGATPEATEAPMFPVSINEGLASLDSYRLTYTSDIFDSVTQQRSVATFVVARDREADASYTRNETRTTLEGDEAASGGDLQEQYAIGNQVCVLNLGEAEVTTLSETAKVMGGLMSQVVSFNPLIEDPVLVGEATVNGVPVRNYTFELRSLDASTNVEASRAEGSYALAVDGDYLVHYLLDLELRSGAEEAASAESSVFHIEVSLEDINQPVEITFPPECQAAGALTE